MEKMPDESCRNCGFEIKSWSKCQYCLETIQQICTKCKIITPIKFHFNCNRMSGTAILVNN